MNWSGCPRGSGPTFAQFQQGRFQFTGNDARESSREVCRAVVGGVGTVDHRRNSSAAELALRDFKRQLAILEQAHLGQKLETVFAHGHQIGPDAIERGLDIAVESRVQESNFDAVITQIRGRDQGVQRRIRLHLANLLAVRE